MAAATPDLASAVADGERRLAAWSEDVRRRALAHVARLPPHASRAFRLGVLALILSMYVLGFVLPSVRRQHPITRDVPVEVRLLDIPSQPPLPVAPARASRMPARAHVQSAPATSPARIGAAAVPPLSQLQIYSPDGSVRLPFAAPSKAAPTPEQVAAELMQRGHNVLHCRQTRFAAAFRRDESLGDAVARKYLSWIGLYNAAFVEARAARRAAAHADACDG